jgi:hypothetical protein
MKEVESTKAGPRFCSVTERFLMNCDACIFFEYTDYGTNDMGVVHAFGECHRYPPTPITGSSDCLVRFAKFPRVADDTWCGDFQSRRGMVRTEMPHQRVAQANAAFDAASQADATDANRGANVGECHRGRVECQCGTANATHRQTLGTPDETKRQ